MELIADKIFEPLRKWVGGPIKVNSFFRSPELNTAIGGSKTSQHCKGQAIDVDDVYGFKTNAEMYTWIKENLNFDTFQEVFHLLQNFNYENVDGFREFKKLFENGLEEFLLTYWQVDSDLEFYTSKLK